MAQELFLGYNRSFYFSYLRLAMPVLYVDHQGEPLSLHAVAAEPETRDLILALGTVDSEGVVLHLFGSLEVGAAALPIAGVRRLRRRPTQRDHHRIDWAAAATAAATRRGFDVVATAATRRRLRGGQMLLGRRRCCY